MEDHQWQGVVAAMLQSHGLSATATYAPAELLASPQLAYRQAFRAIPAAGPDCRVVGSPYRPVGAVPAASGPPDSPGGMPALSGRRLRGLRVLEIGHVLAAPLAGAVLGALGADVTKLEDTRRLDMYRCRGPYVDLKPDMNWTAYFAMVNHSKRSVALDVDASSEKFQALVADAEAVIENLGGKRSGRLGVSTSQLSSERPGMLAVSSSGFGQDGPLSSYRAYAYNLHAACGLSYLTRNQDGRAADIDLPWADLISGYALAMIVAAWAVSPAQTGGAAIDFAMADLVVSRFNEFVAAASLDPGSDDCVDRANEQSPYAPNGVYPAGDGWLAFSVDTDEQYARLRNILGDPELSKPRYATARSRFESRRELDAGLQSACADGTAAHPAERLSSVGIPAEELLRPDQLPDCEQLVARGFFTFVDHPEWGHRRLIGIPWRPLGQDPIPLGPPPLLGS